MPQQMKLPSEFEDELSKLPRLTQVATALAQFAAEIGPVDRYERDASGRWVSQPGNFVTFKVQWQRARSVAITVRGYPTEFRLDPDTQAVTKPPIRLAGDQGGYSVFRLTSQAQLGAAAAYVAQASEIYAERGGHASAS